MIRISSVFMNTLIAHRAAKRLRRCSSLSYRLMIRKGGLVLLISSLSTLMTEFCVYTYAFSLQRESMSRLIYFFVSFNFMIRRNNNVIRFLCKF